MSVFTRQTAVRLAKAVACVAVFASVSVAAVKHVAVVEMEIDMNPGEAAKLEMSEVRLITDELREKAVNNLPRGRYNVMTTETVMAQSGSVLSECAEENCVITLGSRIGADYIVRGKLGKFQSLFTLSAVIYETENGFLVASSRTVRSERMTELLEEASAACEEMYRTFAGSQSSAPQPKPQQPVTYAVTVNVNPPDGGYVTRSLNKTAYSAGEPLVLTATAYDGYAFTGWSGTLTSAKATIRGSVKGDMAMTANFYRQSVESSSVLHALPDATGAPPESRAEGAGTGGYYIGVSAPMFASPPLGGEWASIEGGWFGDNRLACGFEFGGGVWGDAHNYSNPLTGVGHRETLGGGFNISRMGERWVLGLSAGYWHGRFELENYPTPLQTVNVFGGPFIKLRYWRICEVSYRGLLGYKQDGSYDSNTSTFVPGTGKEFTIASQFKFGLRFEIAGSSTQRFAQQGSPQMPAPASGMLTDSRDGRTYRTVVIGGKRWMAENLNYKTKKSYCYGNNNSNCEKYGRLYSWDAAMTACPTGWHLPTRQDWDHLGQAAGGNGVPSKVGDINLIKWDSAGTRLRTNTGWTKVTPNKNVKTPISFDLIPGTDDYGFSALPNGLGVHLNFLVKGYSGIGYLGIWWTDMGIKNEFAYSRSVSSGEHEIGELAISRKYDLAVRCVQD
jgi:uncharacterized protein (TIGR02145 family)